MTMMMMVMVIEKERGERKLEICTFKECVSAWGPVWVRHSEVPIITTKAVLGVRH